ncbi:integrase core domain-containing protein [Thermanaerovibrio acidaminovorans]
MRSRPGTNSRKLGEKIASWIHWYNEGRPNQSLGTFPQNRFG